MLARHVAAARRNCIAQYRLAFEGVAGRGPIAQVAGFEIEIKRLAIGSDGTDAFGRIGGR
jgi:hypothetical protein